MAILYHIVPDNNGYFIVGKNQEGKECLLHKAYPIGKNVELVFYSKNEAKQYLKEKLTLNGKYNIEAFWRSDTFTCPACGSALEVEWINTLQAEFVDYICTCRNKYCKTTWSIFTDKDKNIIDVRGYSYE